MSITAPLTRDMRAILDVAVALAAHFDLDRMLEAVVQAATQVLNAERGSVWLYDEASDELVLDVATDMTAVRVPAGVGLVGTCARTRNMINVPDCYAEPRFDKSVDRKTGYRTRCMLTLPLIDHQDKVVGVMQVLNKRSGVFDEEDERLAVVLAAQCAIALQRVRMMQALIEGERMRHELETARVVQMATLPATMPAVAGYDVHGACHPAELTGGDTFDLWWVDSKLAVLLADATGHGIAPALSVTQMQAMLRMAFRLGSGVDAAMIEVNNQLADWLPDDRFITAFLGMLDPATHRLTFQSAGQGPILHYDAQADTHAVHRPTFSPLGALRLPRLREAVSLTFAPGDVVLLCSDGIFEARDAAGEEFGVGRVQEIVRAHRDRAAVDLVAIALQRVREFVGTGPQEDDITLVVVKRDGAATSRRFRREIRSLPQIVAFAEDTFTAGGIDRELRHDVDFALEELFTNMVKYGRSESEVEIAMRRIPGGVEVTLIDRDVEPFDVTAAPDVDVTLPADQRRPGGLGLHLTRRLVDAMDYRYDPAARESRITFRKTSTPGHRGA